MRADLGDVEWIVSELLGLLIGHDLYIQSPARELLLGYGIIQVSRGVVWIAASQFTSFACW